MDSELKRSLILENFSNPVNKGLTNDPSYLKEDKNNSSCIDHFTIELKLNGDVIEDIRFDGEACAVATSSLSIGISKLIGKTKEEALLIIYSLFFLSSFISSLEVRAPALLTKRKNMRINIISYYFFNKSNIPSIPRVAHFTLAGCFDTSS